MIELRCALCMLCVCVHVSMIVCVFVSVPLDRYANLWSSLYYYALWLCMLCVVCVVYFRLIFAGYQALILACRHTFVRSHNKQLACCELANKRYTACYCIYSSTVFAHIVSSLTKMHITIDSSTRQCMYRQCVHYFCLC